MMPFRSPQARRIVPAAALLAVACALTACAGPQDAPRGHAEAAGPGAAPTVQAAPLETPTATPRATPESPSGIAPYTPVATKTIGCDVVDQQGTIMVDGRAQSTDAMLLADELGKLVDAHPESATGVAMCSGVSGAQIFVPHSDRSLAPAAEAIARKYPEVVFHVVDVVAPLSVLLDATPKIISRPEFAGIVTMVGPDILTGGFEVGVMSDADAASPVILEKVRTAVTELTGRDDLPIRIVPMGQAVALSAAAAAG
jgi:hypothetical protein